MTGKTQYTIKDLARMLNLSKSTVSRALKDQYDVNPETRKRVLDLAGELDFEPNILAASLRGNKSQIIGVIIPSFAIPFYSIALTGIQQAASENGYSVMVCQTSENYDNELTNISFLLKSRVDGILISLSKNTGSYDHLGKLAARGIPVVLFNRVTDELDLPGVLADDYRGAHNITRHLIETGCKRIAHISGPETLLLSQQRKKGFTDAVKEAGLPVCDDLIAESDFTLESGKNAARKILSVSPAPDALFCVCDAVAFGAMAVIRESGLGIPGDISVAGFTNEPVSELVNPPLSTVSQPIEEIGRTAVELLIENMKTKNYKLLRKRILLPTQLIIRDSTRKQVTGKS